MTQQKRTPILVLECICGQRFTLPGRAVIRGPSSAASGHREARSPEEEQHRYSWLEGCLESLEGKEARREYYARLEQAAP